MFHTNADTEDGSTAKPPPRIRPPVAATRRLTSARGFYVLCIGVYREEDANIEGCFQLRREVEAPDGVELAVWNGDTLADTSGAKPLPLQ